MCDTKKGGAVYYSDPSGNTIKFFDYKGIPFPTFPGDMVGRMNKLQEFQARSDDVYICGYVKAGTNWLFEITNMILSGQAEHVNRNKMNMMLECKGDELDTYPSPRILNTHLLVSDLPEDIIKKNSRIIYLMRNPKDVCVSHFHHNVGLRNMYEYDGDWTNYFQLWLDGKVDYGSYFDVLKHWEEELNKRPDLNVHIIYYENLKLDFLKESKRLAEFLGISRPDEFFDRLNEKCHIHAMKAFKNKCYTPAEHAFWRNNQSNFFRKGIIGDWKTQFTVAQNEQFNSIIAERMQNSDLKFIYEA